MDPHGGCEECTDAAALSWYLGDGNFVWIMDLRTLICILDLLIVPGVRNARSFEARPFHRPESDRRPTERATKGSGGREAGRAVRSGCLVCALVSGNIELCCLLAFRRNAWYSAEGNRVQ